MSDYYRKKPVVIRAWQVVPGTVFPQWVADALKSGEFAPYGDGGAVVKTLEDGKFGEARHIANRGDWLIKGIAGELYFCKPDIFEATYEKVTDEEKPS